MLDYGAFFILYSCCCLTNILFFVMPETKGLTLEEIEIEDSFKKDGKKNIFNVFRSDPSVAFFTLFFGRVP